MSRIKLMILRKKAITAFLLISGFCWGQSRLAVPSTSSDTQCQGTDCPNQTDNQNASPFGTNESPTLPMGGTTNRFQVPPDQVTPDQLQQLQQMLNANRNPAVPTLQQNQTQAQTNVQQPTKPPVPTEFQKFVFTSTGRYLPIYGQDLFDNAPSTFAPVDHVPVPADYTIGPEDQLLIRVWGQIDLDAKVSVDRNGQIYLPKVGTLTVAGLRYDQLQSYLQSNIGRLFKNFNLSVTLGRLRSIQVFVVGRAKQPGAYTVGSLSTLVNALFASGGPDTNGSMRHILLKRQDQLVVDFDLYDLIVNGDKSKDVVLRPGDVIQIAPVGEQVAVTGSVNLPAIYEMRQGESVKQLLDIAGGLSTTADNSRAVLERIENRVTRKVEEFALDAAGLQRKIEGGDILRVFPISPRIENAVTLRGNVAHPGRYPWHEGMRVRDLIPTRDSIITPDYWSRQNLLGENNKDWIERTLDVQRKEQERKQAEDQLQDQLSTVKRAKEEKTDIKRNPAEINWDYAVIQRLDPENLTSKLIPFNLGKAIEGGSDADNIALQPGDVITIFSQADVDVPNSKQTKYVRIEGEVKAPGVYQVLPGETLRDIVERAGGVTPNAYLYASEFSRESTRKDQQRRLTEAVNQMETELQARSATVSGAGSPDEVAAARLQLDADRRLIQQMRATAATGRIVLELKPTDADVAELPAIQLEDGDRLYIPSRPATVQVIGAVYNQNAFVFRDGKTLNDFLRLAGGGTKEADSSRTFVIRADGSVTSKQMHRSMWSGSFESLRLTPGDTIVVPQKIHGPSFLRGLRDWTQVFAQLALGAAAIKVISE